MKKLYKKVKNWIQRAFKAISPGKNAFKGASIALYIATAILLALFTAISTYNVTDPWMLVLMLGFILIAVISGYLAPWVIKKIHGTPKPFKRALFICIPLLLIVISFSQLILFIAIIVFSMIGAAVYVLKQTGWKALTIPQKVVTLLGLVIGLAGITTGIVLYIPTGFDVDPIENAAMLSDSTIKNIDARSPSEKGSYPVAFLSYGSGKDKHRPEFGEDVTIKTDSVNGVAFLDNWSGISGWYREKYWGFDDKSLPLNARVWYPQGDGPFPLALIVHGNHSMQDYSDPGYEYLGQLLASRGIILASVDENFINGSWSDIIEGLNKENDARGWLLLEHLRLWHEWNADPNSSFYGKIDTDNLALIGHSRGGEAVSHAAMLNALSRYPDDASIELNYNYNIRSIVAIAPVDGQYEPGKSRTKFKNVSYLVLHGAHDSDVSSFMGSMQYERIKFDDDNYHFKAGVYIYGANHGQFNTSWGNNDVGHPFTRVLNLKQLLPAEDQRKVAEVYISAFFESTLRGKKEYMPLFMDARKGKDWLPKTIYLNQFEDTNTDILSNYDEDFDVSTTTFQGGTISSKNLTVWREQEIELKWQEKGSRAAVIGWNYSKKAAEDTTKETSAIKSDQLDADFPDSLIASYSIRFEHSLPKLDSTSVITFSVAESTEDSNPKTKGKWKIDEEENNEDSEDAEEEDQKENEDKEEDAEEKEDEEDAKKAKPSIDFSIVLTDSSGNTLRFPLSRFSALQREIKVTLWKSDFLEDSESEKVFQTFGFAIKDLMKLNPDFNPTVIAGLSFRFDKSKEGVIVVDNIGWTSHLE